MNLNKIKCVIIDFDKTLYSDADLTRQDEHYIEYFYDKKLIKKTKNSIKKLIEENKPYHMVQCIFKLSRESNISDDEIYEWLNNHIYNFISPDMKIVKPDILKQICSKLPVYLLSDSCPAYLQHYFDLFGYKKEWFKGCISNDFKSENMSKTCDMLKIVKLEKLKKNEVLMIGDSLKSDIIAANNAGIESFQVRDVDDTEFILKNLLEIN